MEKLKMHSPNLTQDNIARIRDLFPGCVTEAKGEDGSVKLAVDFDQLRQELSDSIVEGPQERYQLNWPGKREALLTANAPIAKTLRPVRTTKNSKGEHIEESVNFDTTKNIFIEGDNLDALKLLQAGGQDFRMVFIGSGADAAEVQEYAKPLGSKCIFTGAISQRETLRAWYCRADLFLFPSSYDTNGLVVREAAACDLAAVLIDGSCAAEGVTDGVDGFLIDENAGSMAAKLQEICKRPECMAQVGCQAGDRLYLSWGDAVKRARERYGIVMENYRMGRYDDHHRPMDGVLNAQGSIMDALAKLRDLGDGLAERYREGWDEHREGIQERRNEFREEFQERLEEHREGRRAFRTELKQKGEALWQKLDRYL